MNTAIGRYEKHARADTFADRALLPSRLILKRPISAALDKAKVHPGEVWSKRNILR